MKVTIEMFVIEMKYIQKVFQQEFWDAFSMAVSKDAGASQLLMIPKTVGFVMERYTKEQLRELPSEDRVARLKRQQRRIIRSLSLNPSN